MSPGRMATVEQAVDGDFDPTDLAARHDGPDPVGERVEAIVERLEQDSISRDRRRRHLLAPRRALEGEGLLAENVLAGAEGAAAVQWACRAAGSAT